MKQMTPNNKHLATNKTFPNKSPEAAGPVRDRENDNRSSGFAINKKPKPSHVHLINRPKWN